ncbi:MAG: beta-ketoacyl-ACP reductase [Firmicutes bacterium HGW-Firmicutes-14]|nr:MAG: beta-ketoacyl-ACP reductase [Firmicutes bacterium HGW-Firmicutes-14]
MNLQGKAALVTGASRGIGRAIALKLAANGARVGVHCLQNQDLAEQVAEEITRNSGEAEVFLGDISDSIAATQIVEETISVFGRIDILVNNAGIVRDYPAAGMEDTEWSKVLNVNLTGTFNMCRAAAKPMMMQKSGRIINISSFIARLGGRGQANYSASKGGIESLTRSLAVELGPRNITVNAIAPGAVLTDMSKEAIEAHGGQLVSKIPLNRLGKPEDIASLAAYLASDEAGYITGEVIGVTGGLGLWS